MAVKEFEIENIGTVHVYKRRGARSLRLTVSADGKVRVTIPTWVPYASGVSFAATRADWIIKHQPAPVAHIVDGQRVGKAHRVVFASAAIDQPSSRLVGTEIRVIRPHGIATTHKEVQKVAQKASVRALRAQAEALLPKRLKQLADTYGFGYSGVQVKRLKGRWGSCDAQQLITLNLFLMQLPWQLIDYVLLHELVHTKHLNHGPDFWDEFLRHEPRAKAHRKLIKTYKPILDAGDVASAVA